MADMTNEGRVPNEEVQPSAGAASATPADHGLQIAPAAVKVAPEAEENKGTPGELTRALSESADDEDAVRELNQIL